MQDVHIKICAFSRISEIGETVEQTVAREVMEEVGLKVKNIRYYKSQPWAFSDTLLMGFYCDLDGNDAITLDREELAVAEWFEREDIPVEPSRDSLTNEMILQFKNERTAVKKKKENETMRAEFDESLVTGNEMIDTQHKELIDKINKLLDSCETSKEK